MPMTLLWNSATMPDGCELFSERARGSSRVRGFANALGGALADGGGFDEREVRVRLLISGVSITDARGIVDDWQAAVGNELGWLRQLTATMDRRIYAKPANLEIRYPETIFDYLELEQTFLAPDPRWYDLTTSSQVILPSLRYVAGSDRVDVDGSAGADASLYYWPAYGATEVPQTVEVTNRYGNLLHNADFGIKTPLSTQEGVAQPWSSVDYSATNYDPFILPSQPRQYLDIDAGGAAHTYITHALIPYAPSRNQTSPTTDTLVWAADVTFSQLSGDWRFYLRLHALTGTAFGGGTADTATGPIYGTTGAAATVAGANLATHIAATMTATGGLSAHVRQLRPEFVFVAATGAGAQGGGRIAIEQPYVRTDGGAYDYRPHRTLTFDALPGRYALEADLDEREATLWAEAAAPTNAMPYLTDDAEFFDLRPGSNELHVEITMTNTQAATGAPTVYPVSSENLTYLNLTNRWWA